jgi:hypothetical protein
MMDSTLGESGWANAMDAEKRLVTKKQDKRKGRKI